MLGSWSFPTAGSLSVAGRAARPRVRRAGPDPHGARGPARDLEALGERDPRHPRDLSLGLDHGQRAADRAGHLPVGEEVLKRLGALETERAHPVSLVPRTNGERARELFGVEDRFVERAPVRRKRALDALDLADQLPFPEATRAGHGEERRLVGTFVGQSPKPEHSILGGHADAASDVEGGASPPARELLDFTHLRGGQRKRSTGGLLGEPPQQEAAKCARELLQACRLDGGWPAAGPGLLAGAVQHGFQKLRLLSQLLSCSEDVFVDGRMHLTESREHVVPDAIAREAAIEIGFVFSPRKPCLLAVPAGVLTGDVQKRPDEPAAAALHSEKRAPARRGCKAVEDGLDLITGGVAGRDQVEAPPLPDRLGCRVPGLPRPRLEIAGTGDADPLDFELDAKRLPMRNTEAPVLLRAGPQ